jgi:hypothetical protein
LFYRKKHFVISVDANDTIWKSQTNILNQLSI